MNRDTTHFAIWRASMAITLREAADLLDVSPRTVQAWQSGDHPTSFATDVLLAILLEHKQHGRKPPTIVADRLKQLEATQ